MTGLKPALCSTVSDYAGQANVSLRNAHAAAVWCSQGLWAPARTKPSHLALRVCVWECMVAVMVPV